MMKNKSSILKILCGALFASIMAFCSVALVVCGSCSSKDNSTSQSPSGSEPDSPTIKITVSLDKSTLTLAEWESATLVAEKTGTNEAIVWSSANESVATVENGKVTALSVGETTITASIGETSDSCKVIVEASTVEPVIGIEELDAERKLILRDSGSFDLHASVLWNGKAVDGATVSWTSDNEEIAAVTGNGYNASVSGLKEGETIIRVLATLRGKTAVYTFSIKVNPESALLKTDNEEYTPIEGGYKITLNAVEETDGDGTNVAALDFYASYKGEKIENPAIVWTTENEDIIELDSATGKITAKQGGNALINGVWHYDVTGKDYSVKVSVEAVKVNVVIEDIKNIVVNRAEALTLTLSNESIQSYEVDGKSCTDGFTVEENVVKFNGGNFDVNDQTKTVDVKVITDKRIYSLTANSYYAIANVDEWKGIWNKTTSPKVFSKASVIKIENDIDVSGYAHNGNISYANVSFSGVFDGQGHTIKGATAGWEGLFSSVAVDGVVKNVAFVGIKLLQETTLFYNVFNGTIENCYFEASPNRTSINATPAFTCTLGRTAVIRNVVMNIRGRGINEKNAQQKAIFRYYGTGEGLPTVSGLYAFVDVSDGVASWEDTINDNISLYSSAAEMNAAITALPEKFSSDIWQIYDGILSFKSSENVIKEYIDVNKLEVPAISSVNKEVETTLVANKDCVWSIEGLDESAYSLNGGRLTLSSAAPTDGTFTIVATYTEPRFGHVYTDRIENVLIKNKPAEIKNLSESYVVGLNRTGSTFAYTLDEAAEILGVTVGGAEIDGANYSASGSVVTLNLAAFTKTGSVEVSIETENAVYKANATVADYAIGDKTEFLSFWNKTVLAANTTVSSYVVLTDNITVNSTANVGIANYTFDGVFDGRGYTIIGAPAGYMGLFYDLGANGVIKNVAFIGTGFQVFQTIFGNKLEGRVENCYFEGYGVRDTGTAVPALANQIGANAVIKNVVIYSHGVVPDSSEKNGVFNNTINKATMTTAPSGLYVINTSSNGNICSDAGSTDTSGIHLYSSLEDFKAKVKERPDDISEQYWNILAGL